ncbi:MAG: hypothetical protein JW795_06830 [Chitinivibrionales bacterium]|nr:hypothetical protein [Chitinivibrionales bacterium]
MSYSIRIRMVPSAISQKLLARRMAALSGQPLATVFHHLNTLPALYAKGLSAAQVAVEKQFLQKLEIQYEVLKVNEEIRIAQKGQKADSLTLSVPSSISATTHPGTQHHGNPIKQPVEHESSTHRTHPDAQGIHRAVGQKQATGRRVPPKTVSDLNGDFWHEEQENRNDLLLFDIFAILFVLAIVIGSTVQLRFLPVLLPSMGPHAVSGNTVKKGGIVRGYSTVVKAAEKRKEFKIKKNTEKRDERDWIISDSVQSPPELLRLLQPFGSLQKLLLDSDTCRIIYASTATDSSLIKMELFDIMQLLKEHISCGTVVLFATTRPGSGMLAAIPNKKNLRSYEDFCTRTSFTYVP